jgi:(E)-4-hydroxy-3-methylbut-2-enyl-diphosphate synthase
MVESYRLLADTVDFPLHLGVTEAGPLPGGVLKGTAGIATLLNEGIGDTIRFSLTADPIEEVKVGKQLLEVLGLRERSGLDLIACPSCGRAEVDVIEVAANAQEALATLDIPIQVAVMGCVVNGPGEAKSADLGIAAGRQRGHLFVRGKVVKVVPEDKMVDSLVEWALKISEAGIEGALADADLGAEAEAEADRAALIESQGEDVNSTEKAVDIIRRR